ncbi:hypothetical protein P256_00247 [Acinetobacter nectaris CIP 110549]|uniref:DUF2280 domain-containing protein n=1 Tax=Acinetobacter nectaris CIP 110549 TaxID=1392540 RepID=V2TGL2_9GAMM|nr:DUF2280 domain-containing protein [Acinetobacter nectaris]ESK41258.1 hypothetical protein P256_00247 [Acinetobacter nectaris CIP 110549]
MATLKEPVKIFIVQSLACMKTPQQVADAVKQEFGLGLDRRQCASYDPTKHAGKNLSKKLKLLFEETRRDFQDNILDIPIANKAFRLRELQEMYESWGKNRVMKQQVLKQAFQETDGRVTRQEITGKDGQPMETNVVYATQKQVEEAVAKAQSEY